jgi:hypothetical protein
LDDAGRETARLLRDTLEHYIAANPSADRVEALSRIVREQAFTVLNRLAALRMAEAREILTESISRGYDSKGFQLYLMLAGTGHGETGDAYRSYLFSIFDEFALDLNVLFDRFSPQGRLFPREAALLQLLGLMNEPEVAPLWGEDETIGWIYQYFNDPIERKKMRDPKQGGSAAPRNSRELAVRNQFFTPRYVVEFLTDNTLGRIWYEMTRGETRLKDHCRYMIRRPNEVFLEPGVLPPKVEEATGQNLSQEELLRQPLHIPHRPLKDPRTIRVLDPACGSMHFGLYAYDLLEVIYAEAWELEGARSADAFSRELGLKSLREIYADEEALRRDVPRLIIEHNLHGIDIDPRAVQIAGLSLWLRAQRAWAEQGVKPSERPSVKRSNIVCAEPMPGECELLEEFIETLPPDVPGALVRSVFERMELAGEAGSLLRIEDDIREPIAQAKQEWLDRRRKQAEFAEKPQGSLGDFLQPTFEQSRLDFDFESITDEKFFDGVEDKVLAALREYAERAANGEAYARRLFADDAEKGFAFIELLRKKFDVVLMNPPFGDASIPSKKYIDDTYADTKGDVYKAFVESFQNRLIPAGYLGIISSRTGFFLGQSEDWRTRVVLRLFRPIALADLGSGVLDAMVEVAAYVLRSLSEPEARALTLSLVPVLEKVVRDKQDRFSLPKWQAARGDLKRHQAVAELEHLAAHGFIERYPGDIVRYTPLWHEVKKVTAPPLPVYQSLVCARVLAEEDKAASLADAINHRSSTNTFVCSPSSFSEIPGAPFAYWAGSSVRRLFSKFPAFESDERCVRVGLQTSDDARFLRSWWESPPTDSRGTWVPFAKGGSTQNFFADVASVLNWQNDGAELKAWAETLPGSTHWSRSIRSPDFYFRPGITWPLRASRFSPQAMPAGCVFSIRGQVAFANDGQLEFMLGLMASAAFDMIYKTLLGRFGFPEFAVGVLQKLPFPTIHPKAKRELESHAAEAWRHKRLRYCASTESQHFVSPGILQASGGELIDRAAAWATSVRTSEENVAAIQSEIDDLVFSLYGLDETDRAALTATLATEATGDADAMTDEDEEEAATANAPALTADLLAYALGCAFGRWDIRFATGERTAPEPPDPFAPLPVCPPGMLQNEEGLSARPEDVPDNYPLSISWPGILVDDPGHAEDIEARVREVLHVIWPERADAIEQEACEILAVRSLREYFRKPNLFFAEHLKRYSKSRRQAPIYWPLSTPSGSYTLWLYYHRLDPQTLYRCVVEFVEPKLRQTNDALGHLRAKPNRARDEERELERLQDFALELQAFSDELLRVAELPWRPDLNDGVQITAASLWKLFRLPKWQKTLKETWQKLERGDYDWAHLAYTLWPERVRDKCKTDKSLAIAHGLEDLPQVPATASKKKRGRKTAAAKVEDL